MTTRAEAKSRRILELTNIAKRVTEYTLAPEMDDDARGLYWIGPWDFKRWARDEKGNYKKDESGDNYQESVRDPLPAIHIHLGAFRPRPSALKIAPAHRCIGYLEERKLLTTRFAHRNWHKKLGGYTVNLHILQNAQRFGFDEVEINGKSYAVEYLLTCPPVPRSESGGYENNLLLVDPDNKPRDPLATSDMDEIGIESLSR
jgi:hypothetical protein